MLEKLGQLTKDEQMLAGEEDNERTFQSGGTINTNDQRC